MPFCINCGAHNLDDAVYCLACGNILYRPPEKLVPTKAGFWRAFRLPLLITLIGILAVFAMVFSSQRPAGKEPNNLKAQNPPAYQAAKTAPLDEAVLMIIGLNSKGSPVSQGSGFIINSGGLAGSNFHVFRGVTQAFARCCGGRKFEIESVEGADLEKDLVVFQLHEIESRERPSHLPHVTFAPTKDLAVGQRIIAVGSPQGLENTVSDGILSAVREYDSVRYLQITAPISPGSSGGPVLDSEGHMIGVTTFQFERGQNLNFAIAADYIQPLLDQHFQVSMKEFQMTVRRVQHQTTKTAASEISKQVSGAGEPTVNGVFNGVVHNQTGDVSAQFGIVVSEEQGILTGCMGVRQPLFGSGALDGFVLDSDITFVVSSAIGKITFQGKKRNAAVNGTYTVEGLDGTEQHGTFALQRTSKKGLDEGFDASTCPTDAEMNN
jgi:serine protease Do